MNNQANKKELKMCKRVNMLMCKSLTNGLTHLRISEFKSQFSILNSQFITILLLALTLVSCGGKTETPVLRTQQDTLSWAMGMSLAQTADGGFYNFDKDLVVKAFESCIRGEKQPLTQQDYNDAVEYISFLVTMKNRQNAQSQAQNADQAEEALFAKLTKENPDLQKSPDGYYYQVLRQGHGPRATVGQRIRFDFKGVNLVNNQLIEQTYGKRESVVHVLGKPMFQGLLSGIQLMNAGSKYRFYFPYRLVAGANGIPPYTPVSYEVELHEIYND